MADDNGDVASLLGDFVGAPTDRADPITANRPVRPKTFSYFQGALRDGCVSPRSAIR